MIRRPRRSLPATLTALVLLAACALVATIAIQLLAGQQPLLSYATVADAMHNTHWNDLVPAVAGGVAALLGLILVLAAILPGQATVLPLGDDGTGLNSGASRRSLRGSLRTAAEGVDGVSGTTLKLRRRKVAATVRTDRTNTAGLADAVHGAIERRLDQITPVTRPAIKIKVHATRSAP